MKGISSQGAVGGSVTMLLGRSLVMALGFVQFLLVAHFFGTSRITDAFFIAQVVPTFFMGLIEPALNHTFVPVFVESKEKEGEAEAWRIARSLFWIASILSVIGVVVYVLLASPIMSGLGSGFSREVHGQAVRLTVLLSPVMILSVLSALLSSFFFAYSHFKIPVVGSLFPVAATILAILLSAKKIGMDSIPLGMLLGSALQFGYLYRRLPYGMKTRKTEVLPIPGGARKTGRLIVPRLLSLGLLKVDTMVDRYFASFLVSGSISALLYAERLVFSIPTLILTSLGKVLMPVLSKHGARGEMEHLRTFVHNCLKMMGAIIIPVSVILFFFNEGIVRLVFERGAFDATSTRLTSVALVFYNMGLLFFSLNPILNVIFFSMQDTVTPLKIGIFLSGLNLLLDFLLVRPFAHGGLALSTSLVAMMKTMLLVKVLGQRIGSLDLRGVVSVLARVLLASLMTVALVHAAGSWSASAGLDWGGYRAAGTALCIFAGTVLYLILCHALRVREYDTMMAVFGTKIKARFFSGRKTA